MHLVIVFDLDKTIGYFEQLGIIVDLIEKNIKKSIKLNEFYILLDLFPNYFRNNMIKVFKFLKKKKETMKIKVIIYTNNIGPKSWVFNIKNYIENKIQGKLFDKIIPAWKVNNIFYEKKRTSHNKRYDDLLRCGKLKKKDKILFFDDYIHHHLKHKNVTYIHNKPYIKHYTIDNIIQKLYNSPFKKILNEVYKEQFKNDYKLYDYNSDENGSKKMKYNFMKEIKKFLMKNKFKISKKKYKRKIKKNKTKKNNNKNKRK